MNNVLRVIKPEKQNVPGAFSKGEWVDLTE